MGKGERRKQKMCGLIRMRVSNDVCVWVCV
jgi:hypothetical protein